MSNVANDGMGGGGGDVPYNVDTTPPGDTLLHPYQKFALCLLNSAYCHYFKANPDGSYNYTNKFSGLFLEDIPELHEMRASLVALTAVLGSLAVLGIMGNLLVLWIFWSKLRIGPAGYLIIAVATVDILCCAVVIPLRIAREWGTKLHSEVGCKTVELLQHQVIMVSLSLLAAIALDRYWCITQAPKRLFSVKGTKIYVGCSIFLSTLLAFPWGIAVTSQYVEPEHRGFCLPSKKFISYNVLQAYSYFFVSIMLCFSFAAVTFYGLTFSFIRRQAQEYKWYVKSIGEWTRKRDKPRYSDSESSLSSDGTETSDVGPAEIELQVRTSPDGAHEEESGEPREKVLTDIFNEMEDDDETELAKSDAEETRPKSGSLVLEMDTDAIQSELRDSITGISTADTDPILTNTPFHDDPEEGASGAAAGSSRESGDGHEGDHSDNDDGLLRRQRRRRKRRYHRNPWHRLKTRTALTMSCVTILFVCCHIPSFLMTYRVVKMVPVLYYMYFLPHTLAWLVYLIMNKNFRDEAGLVCGFH